MSFERKPLPAQFCNLDRLLFEMERYGLDGLVVTSPNNVFYLSGFNAIAHKSDEPRPYALVLSRGAPDHPVLVVADYYINTVVNQPSWVQDVRAYRAVMMPLDLPPSDGDVDRFIPEAAEGMPWLARLRETFAGAMGAAISAAMCDLGLATARVGFDDLRLPGQLSFAGSAADAYDVMMSARAVKTEAELELLRRATALNEAAILRAAGGWQKGQTWREFNHAYHLAAIDLGGFVRDPGGMVWGHPRGSDAAITLQSGFEDFEIEEGMHLLFDCHGTLDLYCWDGGKTWVAGGEPAASARGTFDATANAVEAVLEAMKPGVRVSELQAIGRQAFRQSLAVDADQAIIFFHGLGLSHMDLAQFHPDGSANGDWVLEENMVVPIHVLVPGGQNERCWVEEVARVTGEGGEPFFSWGFGPIVI